MKFTTDRSAFLKVLTTVSIAIGPKSPTPAYLCFKITVTNDGIYVLGSDNEMTIQSFLKIVNGDKTVITNIEEGAALISAKYLLEIIRRLDGNLVSIEVIDNVIVKISDNQSEFKLNSMNVEEYPDLDLSVQGSPVSFKAEDFKKIVAQTAFAASTKEVRPILTAVNMKADGNKIEFVATDSYRLSKKTYTVDGDYHFEANIPVKTLTEVSKLIENTDVTINISDRKAIFCYGDTKIYSRLINGDFPKTSRMIPAEYGYVLQVNASTFINAMQRVSLLAVERENIVKLSLSREAIEISSKSDQIGSANETISTFSYDNDRFEISYNVNYVIDAIRAAMSEDVILSFAGEMSAFRVTAPNDDSIIQIITPVRSYY